MSIMRGSQIIEISLGTIIKGLLTILAFVFLYLVRDVVAVVLVSVVLASAAEPGIKGLKSWGIPRVAGVLGIYLVALLLFGAVFYVLMPPILGDIQEFVSGFPVYLERTLHSFELSNALVPAEELSSSLTQASARLDVFINENLRGFFSPRSLFGGATAFIFVMVISFYLAVKEDGIAEFLRIITPRRQEEYVISLWERSQRKIGRWFQGQILLGLLVGVLVYFGLTLLGIQYAPMLAILSALLEVIPYFGPVMSAIPAIAIATVQTPILGLWVLIFYVMVQQLENHLIYPLVVQKTVGVSPLLVIVAVLIGGKLGGFFGIILAVPVSVVVVELVQDFAERKKVFSA